MSEDNLPAPGPADDGQRLPAHHRGHGGAMAHTGQGALALDLYRDERRQDGAESPHGEFPLSGDDVSDLPGSRPRGHPNRRRRATSRLPECQIADAD